MSKTVPVEFQDRWFWAYDVSLTVLLMESVLVARETRVVDQPSWLDEVIERLQVHALLGANQAVLLDGWDTEQRGRLLGWIAEAAQRLRDRAWISAADARMRYRIPGESLELRGEGPIDTAAVADLGEAIINLVRGDLSAAPLGGTWFLGLPEGPQVI
jgi:hypothetical protein